MTSRGTRPRTRRISVPRSEPHSPSRPPLGFAGGGPCTRRRGWPDLGRGSTTKTVRGACRPRGGSGCETGDHSRVGWSQGRVESTGTESGGGAVGTRERWELGPLIGAPAYPGTAHGKTRHKISLGWDLIFLPPTPHGRKTRMATKEESGDD